MSLAPANPEARREADAYPTPLWVTRRLMGALLPLLRPKAAIYEPCAGRGHIVREVLRAMPEARIHVRELVSNDELLSACGGEFRRHPWGDALEFDPWPTWDAIIMNPPFSLAVPFVQKALKAAPIVAVLQRMNWLAEIVDAAGGRTPSVLMLPDRISFVHKCFYGTGKNDYELVPYDLPTPPGTLRNARGGYKRVVASDATTYCWYVFEPSDAARVVVLPRTSLAERQEGMWKDQVAT